MAQWTVAMASSHAFAVTDPARWDADRARNRAVYVGRMGVEPPEQPGIVPETDEVVAARYAHVREAFAFLRRKLAAARPDVLIMVADDQNENFTDANLPQLAIYVGDGFMVGRRGDTEGPHYRSRPDLAEAILTGCVEADIDMASVRSFPNDLLCAHAFGPVLRVVDPEARVPVIPVFVNAIHVPAPSPARCYYLGQVLGRIVRAYTGVGRVALYASGGLSHFTGGYPWAHYLGPHGYGAIDETFDRWLLERLATGDGRALAALTSTDLLDHGEIELRAWIALLGVIGDVRPELVVYEPFYRAIMGMGVACWDLAGRVLP
ncbi:MAG TPA: extradiol ring-cleavage dioxygenase [Chloroflexota bacterium]|nr:extradiol ring-cleavage dioxygenase [Chloroflexota bacterium]